MNNIEIVNNKKYGPIVSSRTIAKELGKEHKNVLREIDGVLKSDGSILSCEIIQSEYTSDRGKKYNEFLLTEKGFTVYMFNIQGYNNFKIAYIDEFERMKNQINNQPKQLSTAEQIKLIAQGNSELNEKIEDVQKEVTNIKENTKLEQGEYSAVTIAVNNKVAQTRSQLGINKNDKQANRELFRDINREIKRVANVSTRSQIRQKDFENVMEIIRLWQPAQSTVFLIRNN